MGKSKKSTNIGSIQKVNNKKKQQKGNNNNVKNEKDKKKVAKIEKSSKKVQNYKQEKKPKIKKKSSSERISESKKKHTKKGKSKVQIEKEILSKDQKNELKRLSDMFLLKTINELKDLLKKNNQKISGSKPELVVRCSEGKLLGALPNCPKCFGGKLRFNIKTGEYSCPGYMEDTEMINCNFKSNDIQRNTWLD